MSPVRGNRRVPLEPSGRRLDARRRRAGRPSVPPERGAHSPAGDHRHARGPRVRAGRHRVNAAAFARGASFEGDTLWLHADGDAYYSLEHSRASFARFEEAGGTGTFRTVAAPPGTDAHQIVFAPELWEEPVTRYIEAL